MTFRSLLALTLALTFALGLIVTVAMVVLPTASPIS